MRTAIDEMRDVLDVRTIWVVGDRTDSIMRDVRVDVSQPVARPTGHPRDPKRAAKRKAQKRARMINRKSHK